MGRAGINQPHVTEEETRAVREEMVCTKHTVGKSTHLTPDSGVCVLFFSPIILSCPGLFLQLKNEEVLFCFSKRDLALDII